MNNEEKNSFNKVLIFSIASVLVFIFVVAGLSYSFFIGTVTNGEESTTIAGTAATLGIYFEEGDDLGTMAGNLIPGWYAVKRFSVKNDEETAQTYEILINNIVNTFTVEGSISLQIESEDGGGNLAKTVLPSSDATLLEDITIAAKTEHHYTITTYYNDLENVDQSADYMARFDFQLAVHKYEDE